MQVKKQQLEPDMEQWIGSKFGKEYIKSVYWNCLFNVYAEYIMWMARLGEAEAEISITGKIAVASSMQMTPHIWQKMKRN